MIVDGNDPLDVYAAVHSAVRRARRGEGPTLVECKTYRYLAHTSDDDDRTYRTPQEVEAWRKKDPLRRIKQYLIEQRLLSEADEERDRGRGEGRGRRRRQAGRGRRRPRAGRPPTRKVFARPLRPLPGRARGRGRRDRRPASRRRRPTGRRPSGTSSTRSARPSTSSWPPTSGS